MSRYSANYYKQYARKCLLENRTHTRGYDNCFEDGHGDAVVKYLIKACELASHADKPEYQDFLMAKRSLDSSEYKQWRKIGEAIKLKQAIVARNSWDSWNYFATHGTYEGYKRNVA